MQQVVEIRSSPLGVDHKDLFCGWLVGWLCRLFADGRLMELLNKDTQRGRSPSGSHLCQLIGLIVIVAEHVC